MALVWFVDSKPRSRKPVQFLRNGEEQEGSSESLPSISVLSTRPADDLGGHNSCAELRPHPLSANDQARSLWKKRSKDERFGLRSDPRTIALLTDLKYEKPIKVTITGGGKVKVKSKDKEKPEFEEFVKWVDYLENDLHKALKDAKHKSRSLSADRKRDLLRRGHAPATSGRAKEDDLRNRWLRDVNLNRKYDEVDRSGNSFEDTPVGDVKHTTKTHYVWAEDGRRFRSRTHPMRNPDPVRDDLAVRRWAAN